MIRILYADDEPLMLDLTKEFLEMDGTLGVETASSAVEALDLLGKGSYDVVISDYQMPGMDGLEFLRVLRSSGKAVPFILFTGKGREDVVVKALDEGADFYVQKGTDTRAQFAELRHKVRLVHERHRAAQAFMESEERHRSLFQTMTQGVIYLDSKGQVLAANPAALELLKARDDGAASLLSEIENQLTSMDGRHIEPSDTPWSRAVRERGSVRSEMVVLSRAGERSVFEVSCIPVQVETGAPEQYYMIFNEVTDRYRADDSERRFRDLFDNMNEGVAVHRMAYNGYGEAIDYEILEVNRGFERLMRMQRSEVVGKLASKAYGLDRAPYLPEYAEVARSGQPLKFETYYSPLGKHFVVSAISSQKGQFATVFFDITDIKDLERSLQQLNDVMKALMDAQKEVTFLIKPDGEILIANRAACLQFNMGLEQMRGKSAQDLIGKDTWQRYKAIGDRVVRSGTGEVFEDMINGREYEFNVHPVRSPSGEIDRLAVTIYDITDLRGALHDAAAGELRLSLAVDGIGDGIWDMDLVNNRVVYSPRLEAMLGYAPGEIGRDQARWQDLVHPDDLESARLDYQRFVAEGSHLYSSEHRLRCRDGSYRWILDRGVVIDRLADGTPKRMVGTHMDITGRKEMEERLRREEEKFHNLIEQSTDGVVLVDEHGTVILVNRAFERITGVSRQTVVGSDILAKQGRRRLRMPSENAHMQMIDMLRRLKEDGLSGVGEAIEVDLPVSGGPPMSLSMKPFPIRTDSGVMMGIIVTDNTKRKLAENALHLANTKLNLLNSVTRHDILNQVMVLKMNVEQERRHAHDDASRHRMERIANAVESIRRQVSFTSDYQAMGVRAPEWQNVSEVVGRAQGGLGLEGIQLEVRLTTEEVYADPMLEKVFYTLIEDSLRHGGQVKHISVDGEVREDGFAILYKDDGVGIPEQHKEEIFKRGFGSNSGLGLFFSREILDLTHISIRETGESGKGVRFELLVPAEGFRSGPAELN
jgi:PAS domain S-box-containing protein